MTAQPAPRKSAALRLWWCVVFLAVVGGGWFLLQGVEVGLMRWRGRFMPPKAGSFFEQIIIGFQDFGQLLTIIIATILVAAFDRRRKAVIAAIWIAQIFANVSYNVPKHLIGRYRPYAAVAQVAELDQLQIEQAWLGWQPGRSTHDTRSFPSGHSASAFALALVLAFYYRRLAWMFWVLAAGCAASRYLNAVHWPSDCLAGAAIGYACGWLALRIAARRAPRS